MTAETQAFLELVKRRYGEIEDTKRRVLEAGEIAENLAKAVVSGELTEAEYRALRRELLG